MFIFRATISAVSCLVVPAFICIDLLFSFDDDDDDDLITCMFLCFRIPTFIPPMKQING